MNKTDIEYAGEVAKGAAQGVTSGLLQSFHQLLIMVAGPAFRQQ
jgi:hypothetical protein